MHLKKCVIHNFRSIKNLTIGFENDFQILVGLNEAGKSNILKAASLLSEDVDPVRSDKRQALPDETDPIRNSEVEFTFTLESKDRKRIETEINRQTFAKKVSQSVVSKGRNNYSIADIMKDQTKVKGVSIFF